MTYLRVFLREFYKLYFANFEAARSKAAGYARYEKCVAHMRSKAGQKELAKYSNV